MARNNALNEAIERYVWAKWWDDDSYSHQLSEISVDTLTTPAIGLLKDLQQIVPVRQVYRVQPEVANSPRAAVAIYFAFLEPYGVISGGACDSPANIEVANFRAICELARHGIAAQKMKADGYEPKSFYEKRLAHFALTKAGEDRVLVRINAKGNQAIALPTLAIDETLAHSHSQSVVVHRCLFQGQPPFVGGDLERLCL